MKKIAVIGAGIAGVTTAYKLLNQGFEVTVFDRQRYAAMETSFANGGQLSASNAEVWNTWATVLKGIKWMLQSNAPLLMSPKPSWHKISWMSEFLLNIPKYQANTTQTARMAILARQHLLDMGREAGVNFDFSQCGILHFYKTQKDLEHARKVTRLLAKGGLERIELTPEEVVAKEPALTGDFVGGYWTPSDSTGDIHKFTLGLANSAEKAGATFRMQTNIIDIRADDDGVTIDLENETDLHFDAVVVCAGVGSRAIAHKLGDRVNVYPVKGYSITVDLPDEKSRAAAPTTSLLDDQAKIVTSRLGPNRFRIAGTAEFNGANKDIRASRISPLVDWCQDLFPDVSTENTIPWAGLRPMLPNMMPRVGQGKNPNVFYNTGHGHLGWTLSGATAHIVCEQMVRARTEERTRIVNLGQNWKVA